MEEVNVVEVAKILQNDSGIINNIFEVFMHLGVEYSLYREIEQRDGPIRGRTYIHFLVGLLNVWTNKMRENATLGKLRNWLEYQSSKPV